ncbi:MAG: hypothetical protein WAN36_07520 [Calditrichia bacterium]
MLTYSHSAQDSLSTISELPENSSNKRKTFQPRAIAFFGLAGFAIGFSLDNAISHASPGDAPYSLPRGLEGAFIGTAVGIIIGIFMPRFIPGKKEEKGGGGKQ